MSGLREYLSGGNDGPGGTGRKPCSKCGGEKPPGRGRQWCDKCQVPPPMCHACGEVPIRGRGERFCPECREIRRAARETRAKARKRMRHGKPCRGCDGPKPPGRRVVYCARCATAREKARERLCERCGNAPVRAPRAKLCTTCKTRSAERQAEYKRQWRLDHLDEVRARDRARRRDNGQLERQRIWRALKREQEGRALAARGREGKRDDSREFGSLPSAPLAQLIEQRRRLPLNVLSAAIKSDRGNRVELAQDSEILAEQLGVSPKALQEWRNGKRRTVQFDSADRVLLALDACWWDVWHPCPEECGECEACDGARRAKYAFEGELAA